MHESGEIVGRMEELQAVFNHGGVCLLHYDDVMRVARAEGLSMLADLSRQDYTELLWRFTDALQRSYTEGGRA